MKNWKTLLGGLFATLGQGLTLSGDNTMMNVGHVMTGVGTLVLGLAAKDSNVTGGTVQQ